MSVIDNPVKSILFDIDGTLVFKNKPIPGAVETVRHVQEAGYRVLLLTNMTSRPPSVIAANLRKFGFDIREKQIQSATTACVAYLKQQPTKSCHLLVPSASREMFTDIKINDHDPDFVVISDIGDDFTYSVLDRAFVMLDNGAELIAVQKNMFWYDGDRKRLDCGPFIVGLEAATGKKAKVMGKPSGEFFDQALKLLRSTPSEALIVGDDIMTDIKGAGAMRSVLVGTGKFAPAHLEPPCEQPTWFIESVAKLPDLLVSIKKK